MAHRIVESSASNGAKYCEKCGATENFIRRCPNDADLIIERKRLELEMLRHSASGGDNSFLGHTSISMFSFTGLLCFNSFLYMISNLVLLLFC